MDSPPPSLPSSELHDDIRETCVEIHQLNRRIYHLIKHLDEQDAELDNFCQISADLAKSLENRLNNLEQIIINFCSRFAPSTRNRRRVEMNIWEEQKAVEEHRRKVAEFTAEVLEVSLKIVELYEDAVERMEVLEDVVSGFEDDFATDWSEDGGESEE